MSPFRHLATLRKVFQSTRCYTSIANSGPPGVLHLKTGQSFRGKAFGAPVSVFGETVFSTSITSCEMIISRLCVSDSFLTISSGSADTESMTDPSYRHQLLVFTTPLIGNYGVPNNVTPIDSRDVGVHLESSGIQCTGVIVQDLAEKFSHYEAIESLDAWCKRYNVPGVTGVDTRAITTLLRDQGTTLGRIAVGADAALSAPADHEYWDPSKENLVAQVSTREPYTLNPRGSIKIAVLDFGNKANILRSLVRRDAAVTVLPWNFDFNTIRDNFDGFFLTNGPGDPTQCMEAALNVRRTLHEWTKPVFGICMGHQIIGIAAGLNSYRMRFGNRGHNQPVLALASSKSIKAGRVYVTRYMVLFSLFLHVLLSSLPPPLLSQNHQYALELSDPFPEGWEPFFINCNDSSVEGIKSTEESGKRVWGVQFHPESAGGPLDTIEVRRSHLF